MGNRIMNATGLDGLADWTGASSIDEDVIGGPGRLVIVGNAGELTSSATPVIAGQVVEAFGHVAGYAGAAASLEVEFLTAGGALVEGVAVSRKSRGDGDPRRGLPNTFDAFRGRLTAPATSAQARLKATSAAGAVYLLKPFLESVPWEGDSMFQAGPHANADLNLATWPTKLPPVRADGGLEPIAQRTAFTGDAGVPITRKRTSALRYELRGDFLLTLEQFDRLEAFFRVGAEPFYFTRYDSMQVCRARWLEDGEPSIRGFRNGLRRVSVGLLLQVA